MSEFIKQDDKEIKRKKESEREYLSTVTVDRESIATRSSKLYYS